MNDSSVPEAAPSSASVKADMFNGFDAALQSFDALVLAAFLSYGLTVAAAYVDNDQISSVLRNLGEGIRFLTLGFFFIVVTKSWTLWI